VKDASGTQNGAEYPKYTEEAIEHLSRELPTYLGDGAYTMGMKGAMRSSAPRRQTHDEGRRKYVKKGEVAARRALQHQPPQQEQDQQLDLTELQVPPWGNTVSTILVIF